MKLYAGFDLHSSNTYVAIVDAEGKRVFKKKLHTCRVSVTEPLQPLSHTTNVVFATRTEVHQGFQNFIHPVLSRKVAVDRMKAYYMPF